MKVVIPLMAGMLGLAHAAALPFTQAINASSSLETRDGNVMHCKGDGWISRISCASHHPHEMGYLRSYILGTNIHGEYDWGIKDHQHYMDGERIACAAHICIYLHDTKVGAYGYEIRALFDKLSEYCYGRSCGSIPLSLLPGYQAEIPGKAGRLWANWVQDKPPDCQGLCVTGQEYIPDGTVRPKDGDEVYHDGPNAPHIDVQPGDATD